MVMLGPPRGGKGRLNLPGSREGLCSMAPGPPASRGHLLPASPWQHSACCICGSHCDHSPQLPPLDRTALLRGLFHFQPPLRAQHSQGMCKGLGPAWSCFSVGCGTVYVPKSPLIEAMGGPALDIKGLSSDTPWALGFLLGMELAPASIPLSIHTNIQSPTTHSSIHSYCPPSCILRSICSTSILTTVHVLSTFLPFIHPSFILFPSFLPLSIHLSLNH